jgi:hypothetical protein
MYLFLVSCYNKGPDHKYLHIIYLRDKNMHDNFRLRDGIGSVTYRDLGYYILKRLCSSLVSLYCLEKSRPPQ